MNSEKSKEIILFIESQALLGGTPEKIKTDLENKYGELADFISLTNISSIVVNIIKKALLFDSLNKTERDRLRNDKQREDKINQIVDKLEILIDNLEALPGKVCSKIEAKLKSKIISEQKKDQKKQEELVSITPQPLQSRIPFEDLDGFTFNDNINDNLSDFDNGEEEDKEPIEKKKTRERNQLYV
jgi:hypothetical protein